MELIMKNLITLLGASALFALTTGCNTDGNVAAKQRGVQGAALGAIVGGVIGHQSGRGLEGAAVGGAAGATAGAVWGSSEDEVQSREQGVRR